MLVDWLDGLDEDGGGADRLVEEDGVAAGSALCDCDDVKTLRAVIVHCGGAFLMHGSCACDLRMARSIVCARAEHAVVDMVILGNANAILAQKLVAKELCVRRDGLLEDGKKSRRGATSATGTPTTPNPVTSFIQPSNGSEHMLHYPMMSVSMHLCCLSSAHSPSASSILGKLPSELCWSVARRPCPREDFDRGVGAQQLLTSLLHARQSFLLK